MNMTNMTTKDIPMKNMPITITKGILMKVIPTMDTTTMATDTTDMPTKQRRLKLTTDMREKSSSLLSRHGRPVLWPKSWWVGHSAV